MRWNYDEGSDFLQVKNSQHLHYILGYSHHNSMLTCWACLTQQICGSLLLLLHQIGEFFRGLCVFSCLLRTITTLCSSVILRVAFLQLLSVSLRPLYVHGSICATSLHHRAFVFDGLMEERIQLEKRAENPALSYYHPFITPYPSLVPCFPSSFSLFSPLSI